jgi:hypothetical protein
MFNQQEQEIIRAGVEAGKTKDEIRTAIGSYRSGVQPTPTSPPQQKEGLSFAEDAAVDVYNAGQGVGKAMGDAGKSIFSRFTDKTTGLAQDVVGAGADVFRGVGRSIGNVIGGAAAVATPQSVETKAQETLADVGQAVGETELAQNLVREYQNLSPETKAQVDNILGYLEGLTEVATAGAGARVGKGVVKGATKAGMEAGEQAVDMAKRAAPAVAETVVEGTKTVGRGIASLPQKAVEAIPRKWRADISNIDPQVRTVLESGDVTPNDINKFFQQAKNAQKDASKPTPFEIVGEQAEKAFTNIQTRLTKASEGKERILANMANETMDGLSDIRTTLGDEISTRFGMQFTDDGLAQVAGRQAKLDAPSQKLITEYNDRLLQLGDTPSVREVDDFVDWAQSQLYKQTKEVSRLSAADDKVIGLLKQKTGEINSTLKQRVGGGYAEANARVQDLLDMQDELSRGLGADARKGAGFVKRYFSPASTVTRETFERIKRETGIDLGKDAVLAKFAMENVGDVRQRTLLKSLDLAVQDAAGIDLTRPLSILDYLREKADLDGQELANEILRQKGQKATQTQ